jgi:hypothetical protein
MTTESWIGKKSYNTDIHVQFEHMVHIIRKGLTKVQHKSIHEHIVERILVLMTKENLTYTLELFEGINSSTEQECVIK